MSARHRIYRAVALIAALAGTGLVLVAGTALAKENMTAVLTGPLPLDAAPGTHVTLRWEIGGPGAGGKRVTFDSTEVFVRLTSARGLQSTEAFAAYDSHADGRYSAIATVPAGGIGGVEIGVMGTREYASGKTERADYLFPVAEPPAGALGATSDGISWVGWLLVAGAICGVATAATLFARRLRRWQRRPGADVGQTS